ncbi:extensin-like [Maniola jurtina]|uniref:extensin-like n=1 Tax=Maniola jurtina TaxID=191418 RepID=UPI001E6888B3|nr:extensin-like [Maniola jurtina]
MHTFVIILISAIGVSYATPTCQELHKSQLASLTERMNQMLSSLYTPTTAKAETNTTPPAPANSPAAAADQTRFPYNAYYPYPPYPIPIPQVVYMSPTQYPQQPVTFLPPAPAEPSVKPFKSPITQTFELAHPGSMDVPSPWSNYYDRLPYTQYPSPQYPSVPSPYQPLPYPSSYLYPEYPVYTKMPSYPPYQPPPPAYPPQPIPYPLPPLYHKSSEIPSPPYYL